MKQTFTVGMTMPKTIWSVLGAEYCGRRSTLNKGMMRRANDIRKMVAGGAAVILFLAGHGMTALGQRNPEWRRLEVAGNPPEPRRGVGGIFDTEPGRLVYQGGESQPDPSPTFFADTWAVDLEALSWQELSGPAPSARCHFTWVRDPVSEKGFLFGGFPRNNELWAYDLQSATWSELSLNPVRPPPRCLHAAVLSPERREMVVYGGLRGGGTPDLQDTWIYDVSADQWTEVDAESPPGLRYGAVSIYDKHRRQMIVFGGLFTANGEAPREMNDVWAFKLETRTWQELTPLNQGPSPRQFARGVPVPEQDGLLLWGGRDRPPLPEGQPEFKNDLWFLDLQELRWRRIEIEGEKPSPRFRHTLVRDPVQKRLVMGFGEGMEGEHYGDLWTLDFSQLRLRNEPLIELEIQGEKGGITLSWPHVRDPSVRGSGGTYTIQQSDNLNEWENIQSIDVAEEEPVGKVISVTLSLEGRKGFFRVIRACDKGGSPRK